MRRFILTGAPGAGKTAVIRQLEIDGFSVVEEAATDIIALVLAAENGRDHCRRVGV
jgi:predicted ATPase